MKKIRMMMLAAGLLAVCSGDAQDMKRYRETTITPMAGMTLATVTGDDTDDCTWKMGFIAGAELMHRFDQHFGLSLGAFYAQQGTREKDSGYHTKLEINYFNFPVQLNFYIIKELAIKTGIQLGVMSSCKLSAESGSISAKEDVSSDFETIDVSIPVGLSYEYNNIVFDARYHFGLKDIETSYMGIRSMSMKNRNPIIHNGYFSFVLGYRF